MRSGALLVLGVGMSLAGCHRSGPDEVAAAAPPDTPASVSTSAAASPLAADAAASVTSADATSADAVLPDDAQADEAHGVGDQPSEDVPPATAPVGAFPPDLQRQDAPLARFDGYGDLRLGMTEAQARKAWGGELKDDGVNDPACHYLTPVWATDKRSLALMIENGHFVRYESADAREQAPGGGRVGMSAAQIDTLYAGRVDRQPHKYEPDGHYLRIADAASGDALLFETGGDGKVSRWRVGQVPAVDYVEGCQ